MGQLFLYRLGAIVWRGLIWLAAMLSNKKAGLRARGARATLVCNRPPVSTGKGRCIWMHCASLGEFEQGRPVLEALRKQEPDATLLLTFYSPSGYEVRKNYAGADWVGYLPADSPRLARRWLDAAAPDWAIFVKYELWYDHLAALKHRNVPVWLISAQFQPDQVFFKAWGGLHRQMLGFFERIFVQDAASLALLQSIHLADKAQIAGDTRIDRVLTMVEQAPKNLVVAAFAINQRVLVVGSSWPQDETVLVEAIQQKKSLGTDFKWIIASHDVGADRIQNLEKTLLLVFKPEQIGRLSQLTEARNLQVIIVDSIGQLNALYQYGQLGYIGGGFGKGIHNTLEPAAWGLPIAFGPRYRRFPEAVSLVDIGAAKSISGATDFLAFVAQFGKAERQIQAKAAISVYLSEQKGATNRILSAK
jgi:3-deoxy-D-manno-octulosonic-acid transferase